jgi:CRISPR system Cascade subunit CasB
MTIEHKETGSDPGARFVAQLVMLAEREDRGALASLRRSLQEPSGIAMSACPYVVPFLPAEPDQFRERAYFLIGALFALHPAHEQGCSLGHAFRRINNETSEGKRGTDNESTRSRFVALLDAHPDDVAEHLRHAVSLARSRAIRLDWVRTMKDLLGWPAPTRWVQRRLANDFWRTEGDATTSSPAPLSLKPESENAK